MVSLATVGRAFGRPVSLAVAVTLLASLILFGRWASVDSFEDLWLTKEQQGFRAMSARDWDRAVERFDDPLLAGVAAYRDGRYEDAAEFFDASNSATARFNRGNALMKAGKYRDAIVAYEQAVDAAPDWTEATENLELARHTLAYIEQAREQSETGDQSDLGADDVEFDNEENRGRDTEITRDSVLGQESAEMWMRAIDTSTSDFLRTRFMLEATIEDAQ